MNKGNLFFKTRNLFLFLILLFFSCAKNDFNSFLNSGDEFKILEINKYIKGNLYIDETKLNLKDFYIVDAGNQKIMLFDYGIINAITPNKNSFKKIGFIFYKEKIVNAVIYYFHTDFSKKEIDRNLDNILMLKSMQFSYKGEVVVNSLNNLFLYSYKFDDNYVKKNELEPRKRKQAPNKREDSECYEYYLITTYEFSDGHTETTEEYLFTSCSGGCNAIGNSDSSIGVDCNGGGSGGGGGTGSSSSEETDEIEEEEVEVESEESSYSTYDMSFAQYVPIRYSHYAKIQRSSRYREVLNVIITPTIAHPVHSIYTDSYGLETQRYLVTLAHVNSWTRLVYPLVQINWKCDVSGRYVRPGDVFTRQWTHVKTIVK